MTRRQRTEDRGQRFICRNAACTRISRGKAGTNNLSSVFRPLSPEHGFTLVEMIMVIVITGIIGGMVAMFIRAPMQGYVDSARRAEMTDVADTALRRISRDVRLALPNSVRVNSAAGVFYLDFLVTRSGGRYRASGAGDGTCGADDPLIFNAADTCLRVLGPAVQVAANDQIVVYNLGIPGADAYSGNSAATDVRRAASATGTLSNVQVTSANRLPFDSPSQRFQVVSEQVRYICDPVARTLRRYWWGANAISMPAAAAPPGNNALLADHVSACNFVYDANVVAQRSGLVSLQLTLTQDNESISLYNATHVSNEP